MSKCTSKCTFPDATLLVRTIQFTSGRTFLWVRKFIVPLLLSGVVTSCKIGGRDWGRAGKSCSGPSSSPPPTPQLLAMLRASQCWMSAFLLSHVISTRSLWDRVLIGIIQKPSYQASHTREAPALQKQVPFHQPEMELTSQRTLGSPHEPITIVSTLNP